MSRVLVGSVAALAAVCALQWNTLGRLKTDLASADARAYRRALIDLHDRSDEFLRTLVWLDRQLPVCQSGHVDTANIDRYLFGVYVRARADGGSEAAARRQVVESIAQSSAGH